jgi:glycerophosphoryl diester phosphodiesterase
MGIGVVIALCSLIGACNGNEGGPDGSTPDAGVDAGAADGGPRFVPSIQKMIKDQGPHYAMLIAHRGGMGEAPENTMAAYHLAYENGAASIEIDTRPTKDGVLVIIHDSRLEVATDCTGAVAEKTWDEIRGCTVTAGIIDGFSADVRKIPRLDDVFTWVKDKVLVNLDQKSADMDDLVAKIRAYGLTDQIIFQAGSAPGCLELEQKYPDIFCLAAIWDMSEVDYIKQNLLTNLLQFENFSHYTAENMDMIHARGLKTTINVMASWDILPTSDKLNYLKIGGDFFQTDVPSKWKDALKRYNK